MKKFTLLLMSLLMVSTFAIAQKKLCVHKLDGTRIEVLASEVSYIDFEDVATDPDDDPVVPPVKPDDGTDSSGVANGHDWVDLGLPSGTKWATMNVGADSPKDYGDYFAWGETSRKSTYNWSTYKWMNDGMSSWIDVNKYTFADRQTDAVWYNEYGEFIGDGKITLDLTDDAAYVNWGSSWRMPTKAEQDELRNSSYTTWIWTTHTGVKGYKVTSKINGNSIFLPAAGYLSDSSRINAGFYGGYWSSSLGAKYSDQAYELYFGSGNFDLDGYPRCSGRSVRAVLR
jgi:hypothetical protein